MRILRNRRNRQAVEVLDEGDTGVTFEDVMELVREAVTEAAPDELVDLPQVIADFRRDPDAALRVRRREPVVAGVDVPSMSALTAMIAAALGGILRDAKGNILSQSLSDPTQRALSKLFHARGVGRRDDAQAGGAGSTSRPGRAVITLPGSGPEREDLFSELLRAPVSPRVSLHRVNSFAAPARRPESTVLLGPKQRDQIASWISRLPGFGDLSTDDVTRSLSSLLEVLEPEIRRSKPVSPRRPA